MKALFYLVFFSQPFLLFQQSKVGYYKTSNTNIGTSAISINTLNAKTHTFNHPVYKVIVDSLARQLIISVRQKDVTGKGYTNKGYHLTLKENDSITSVLEDNKLDLNLMGDFLLLSGDTRSARFNRMFGYEQFEYPSKIIYTVSKNNTGLTYNPSFKTGNDIGLSAINLNDGRIIWSAPITGKYDWNGITNLNDSVIIIAAGGLHAVNINTGLLWSYSLTTAHHTNKPITFSSFHHSTFDQIFKPILTSHEEGLVTQISSNILISRNVIYFAAKNKMIALSAEGKLIWEADMTNLPLSNCLIYDNAENILLVNLGLAMYGDNIVQSGKPFVSAYNKQRGNIVLEKKEDELTNIADIISMKNAKILANKNHIIGLNNDLTKQTLFELNEFKYGKFLEFINGDEYFVEKEGVYVPLNFIDDNIVYFKTDHGKVFGLNKNEIEYEYHYTELYKFNIAIGKKKLISQKNKSLLISHNYELLHTFNSGEQAITLNNKLYFTEGRALHIINLDELK